MSRYGSSTVSIYIDASPGAAAPSNMTAFIDTMGGQKITAITEPTHTFGDSWEEHTPVGISKGEPFNMEGHFDDTATSGPHAAFKDPDNGTTDSARNMVVGFGNVAYWHATVRLTDYEVVGSNGKLTRYRVNVLPTSTVTWTTTTS